MSVNNRFQPGSIHIYKVPFVDSHQAKPRPVLITSLPNSKGDVLGIPGTSQIQSWTEDNQVVINADDLISGELHKPAVFPTSKQMLFSPRFFCGEVGLVNTKTLEKVLRMVVGHQVGQFHDVIRTTKQFVPNGTAIPPSGKVIGANELKNMVEASLDGWLTAGRFNQQFEKQLAEFLGVRFVLTVNSGSSANLLAVAALTSSKLGERALQSGDEVITVAAGFPTTVNPLMQYGLVPVFVDITLPGYNIDTTQIEAAISSKTKAIILAHTLGNPFDLNTVRALCDKYGLWLIEDCCDALGAKYEDKLVGGFGDISTLSFYPAHHITTGEGGAVFTNNGKLKKIIESFRDWGRDCYCAPGQDNSCNNRFGWQLGQLPMGYDHKYTYSHVGYNLKITDMQAACGLAQLENLEEFIALRKRNFAYLYKRLSVYDDRLVLPQATPNSEPSWFGFPITLKANLPFKRLDLLKFLTGRLIGTRLLFAGNLTSQPYMQNQIYRIAGDLSNTDKVMENSFWLGIHPALTLEMLDYVAEQIGAFITEHQKLELSK